MIITKQYTLAQGKQLIDDPALINVNILKLERSGLTYSEVAAFDKFNLEFVHEEGLIFFWVEAPPGGEKVKIMYKT